MGMTREEFRMIVKGLKAVFTDANFIPTQGAFDLWYRLLSDMSYQECSIAAHTYMQTQHFPPKPSDLRAILADTKTAPIDYGQGWNEVQTAIRRYGYMRENDALNSMSDITKQVVMRLGYKNLCMAPDGDQSMRANFRMIFQQIQERDKQDAVISQELRLATAEMQKAYLESRDVKLIGEEAG